jgi:hypothetical protein
MPTYADTIQAGTPAVFDTVFYDRLTGEAGDPATVYFSWQLAGDSAPRDVWLYPTVITRYVDADGLPHYRAIVATLDLAPAGTNIDMTGQWDTSGGITVSKSIDVLLTAPEIISPL